MSICSHSVSVDSVRLVVMPYIHHGGIPHVIPIEGLSKLITTDLSIRGDCTHVGRALTLELRSLSYIIPKRQAGVDGDVKSGLSFLSGRAELLCCLDTFIHGRLDNAGQEHCRVT